MANLIVGSVLTESFTGATTTHTITQDGVLEVNLWGAGGGGGIALTDLNQRGGGGGYAKIYIPVVVNDVIAVMVGGGGQKVAVLTTQANGGWPDGGKGARGANSGAENYAGGGGGGSTRIYKNGTLVAVSGGGGGGSRGWGGAAGGSTGGVGYGGGGGVDAIGGLGGTQSAGGAGDPNNASTNGSSLQGGNSIMDSSNGGGGGGGGFFGGGASRGVVSSGGGGSGFRHATLTASNFVLAQAGDKTGVPSGTNSTAYPGPSIGYGGISGKAAAANNQPGFNGAAVLQLRDPDFLSTLPVFVLATGADQSFTVTKAGLYKFRMWGGAGGGGQAALADTPFPPGGAGGYSDIEFVATPGDVIKMQVAKGGKAARASNTAGGGWPDGGHGGTLSAASSGSGGGSTRVWKNNVLMAVAGGGGGSGGLWHRGDAGPGGGTVGGDGYDRTNAAPGATGGTQTTGGTNVFAPTDASKAGASLKGGHGYLTGGNATTPSSDSGAGGGGGYYGGGGGGRNGGYYQGGGGGSGYVNTASGASGTLTRTTFTTAADGARGIPPQTAHEHYPTGSGVAYGGVSSNSVASCTDGGDGYIAYSITPVAVGAAIPNIVVSAPEGSAFRSGTELQVPYSGASVTATVGEAGVLICRLWGGGGGGGFSANGATTRGAGASGGYVLATVQVSVGDVVKLEVGGGGLGAGTGSRAGGYPDGGTGVAGGNAGADYYNGAGGGGSTRLYINNVLQLVAGAGGGGWGPGTTTPANVHSGGGGGLTGGAGTNYLGATAGGGTQTTGGGNTNGNNGAGAALQGGTPTANGGGGGGGGWYGGSGGNIAGSATQSAGGGGGSSWASGPRVMSGTVHEQGAQDAGNPGGFTSDARYVASTARGGLAGATAPAPAGQNGYALVQLTNGVPANKYATFDVVILSTPPQGNAGVPAAPTGDVTDLAVVAINGQGTVLGSASVALPGPVVLNPPLASGTGQHSVFADLVTIGLTQTVTGGAAVSAFVNTDEVLLVTLLAPGNASVVSGANVINTAPFSPTSILLTGPTAQILGYATGGMPIVSIVPVSADASTGQDILADLVTITVNPFNGSATVTGTPSGAVGASPIYVTPMQGSVTSAMTAAGVIGEVFLLAPLGNASTGATTFAEPLDPVTVTATPLGTAVGPANAYGSNNANGSDNDSRWLVRIVLAPPAATIEASVSLSTLPFDQPITVTPISAIVDLGAFVLAPLPRSVVVSMSGLGYANQQSVIGLPTIQVQAAHGYADDSKVGKLHLRRTRVAGKKPVTLAPGELYLNEKDGVLYHRDAQGAVIGTALLDIMQDTSFGSGALGQVRSGDGQWVNPTPTFTAPVLLPVKPGTVVLTEASGRRVNATPTAGRVVYHPFTVHRAFSFSGLSVEVSIAANAFADLGVCEWNDATGPGAVLSRGTVNCSSTGKRTNSVALTLQPGTYAAVIAVAGSGTPVFLAHEAAQKLSNIFVPQGDPTAPASNGYGSDPNAFEPNAIAYIMAEVTA